MSDEDKDETKIGDLPDLILLQYPLGFLQRQALIGEYDIKAFDLRDSATT